MKTAKHRLNKMQDKSYSCFPVSRVSSRQDLFGTVFSLTLCRQQPYQKLEVGDVLYIKAEACSQT